MTNKQARNKKIVRIAENLIQPFELLNLFMLPALSFYFWNIPSGKIISVFLVMIFSFKLIKYKL